MAYWIGYRVEVGANVCVAGPFRTIDQAKSERTELKLQRHEVTHWLSADTEEQALGRARFFLGEGPYPD